MIVAHVMGIPVEETALQFVAVGTSVVTAMAIAGQALLRRLVRRLADPRSDE